MQSYSFRKSLAALPVLLAATGATAQTWTPLTNQPPGVAASSPLLLTDGTVIVENVSAATTGTWWKLTPDKTGSYVNGTWAELAPMPAKYNPLYFASAVLPDGRVIINGGEYNSLKAVWTTKGAIYDPLANTWTAVKAPAGWTTIGDAQSVVLPDGTYMLANCCTTDEATLDLSTMAWTSTGTGKADINDEEGWTLLPGGQVLSVDANNLSNLVNSEILTAGAWATGGNTPTKLPDTNADGSGSHELGPQVLRPNGTVLAVGALGTTAIYDVAKKTWSNGPTFPTTSAGTYDAADGPAALLPDGNVLVAVSPGVYNTGAIFYEIAGTRLVTAPATPNAANDSSYNINLLLLPTGQVLAADQSGDVEIYTPAGTAPAKLAPVIKKFPAAVAHGGTYTLYGIHLNGWSQAMGYGDDYQAATNYPIVRITNTATGDVAYARTANHSSMAVANPKLVSTSVTIPTGIETGASTLVVVANGIASAPLGITIK